MEDRDEKGSAMPRFNTSRRSFLKTAAAGAAGLSGLGLVDIGTLGEAKAFAYEPYPRDDELTTVVTSCAHNCGSRHMLVAHKKGDVIVRLSTDDGRYQRGGSFGKETEQEPQLRACLRGRSYRARSIRQERLLYPMKRVGKRGEGKFKRVSWDEALSDIAEQDGRDQVQVWSDGAPRSELRRRVLRRAAQVRPDRGPAWPLPRHVRLPHQFLVGAVLSGHNVLLAQTFGTIEDGNEDDAFAHSKLIIMWGWNPAYTFHGGNTFYYMRMAKQRGCKFVVVDPQFTDSAAAYDAWWIPIKPNTDAAMLAGMAHYIFTNNLHDQNFINRFCQGMDAGHDACMGAGQGEFQGLHPRQVRRHAEDARMGGEPICGVQGRGHRQARRHVCDDQAGGAEGVLVAGRNATASSTTAWLPPSRR
jgi:anaerobic dimethyl sulfoxide reductase subunit A